MSRLEMYWRRRADRKAKDVVGYCPHCRKPLKIGMKICSSCGVNYIAYEMSQQPDLSGLSSLRKRKK